MLTHDADRLTFLGQLGYVILPELLGLGFRVEWLDLNMDMQDNYDELVFSGVVNFYAVRHLLKTQIGYQHRMELHGQARDNDALYVQAQLWF